MFDRRAVVKGMVAAAISVAVGAPAAVARTFDPAAFVEALQVAGCSLSLVQPIGLDAGPVRWFVHPGPDLQPSEAEREVLALWRLMLDACPDHVQRVADHLAGA